MRFGGQGDGIQCGDESVMSIRDFSMIIRLKNEFVYTVARMKNKDMKHDVKHLQIFDWNRNPLARQSWRGASTSRSRMEWELIDRRDKNSPRGSEKNSSSPV